MMPIARRLPGVSEECDYDKAFYLDPPSHDFLTWLVIAELMRRHHQAPAPLKVRFGLFDGQLGIYDFGPLSPWTFECYPCGVSRAYSDKMIARVLRPAIAMIGAVEEPPVHAPFHREKLARYVEYDYHISQLVDAGRAGFASLPEFTPPAWALAQVDEFLKGERPVIITLREADRQPARNSRIDEWLRFAALLEQRDFPVLIIRDTAKADEPLPPFRTWPRASRNAYVRAALYQRALVNMMVGTGPGEWCLFSPAPYIFFKQLVPELTNWQHGKPEGWREQAHLEVGDQYPFATPLQRMAWCDDTYDHLLAEFNSFLDRSS